MDVDAQPSIASKAWSLLGITYLGVNVIALALGVHRVLYNRYFHPCAGFPGPFWASISHLYLVYKILSVPTYGLELHQRHGPIVRLAPNLLSVSDPELLPRIYHRHADKPPFYKSWLFGTTAPMFQTLKHEEHAAKKRLVSTCCSMKAILAYEHKFDERIDELCDQIRRRSVDKRASIDFTEYLRYFLADTWHYLAYGRPLGCVAQLRDVDGLLGAVQGLYSLSAASAVMPWLNRWLRQPFLRKWFWCHTRTFAHLRRLIEHHDAVTSPRAHQSGGEEECSGLFFERIIQTRSKRDHQPTSSFQCSQDRITAETLTFTAATLDGVAAFISPFMDNMIRHPDVASRVRSEIDAADRAGLLSRPVARYEEITNHLPYFTACIRETLRRDPPAITILPRLVSGPGYSFYDGAVFIPPGVEIGASPYIIHRDEKVFGPDAGDFVPERWLDGVTDPGRVREMERLGMWWGYGDRECAGKNYANVEMQKLCLELLRRFDFEVPPTPTTSTQGTDHYRHEKWAVGMFWDYRILFQDRSRGG